MSNGKIIWMDTRKGDGIEALMTLKKQDMAIFVHDEELLQFASLNPSILDTNWESMEGKHVHLSVLFLIVQASLLWF